MNVYICSAARTAIGTYGGTLRDVHSSELGTAAAKAAIERAGVDKEAIDEVLFGQVLQGGVGQNVARQVCLKSGLPITTPAMTLNKVCASSMRAISLGTQIIRSGENKMMLVGGCESMSGAPYISRDTRWGARMGDKKLVDMMVYDGVFDVFNQYHMGITAENVAEKYGITREMQDEIALASNDAGAAMIIASEEFVKANGLKPLAKVRAWGSVGCDPSIMGVGPIESTRQALSRAGLTVADLDLIESNEAFAAQAAAVNRELGFDMDKVNVNGGAIALGHPIGAAGCRITTTLIHEMIKRDLTIGLATMCIGGGMGEAIIVERDELCK